MWLGVIVSGRLLTFTARRVWGRRAGPADCIPNGEGAILSVRDADPAAVDWERSGETRVRPAAAGSIQGGRSDDERDKDIKTMKGKKTTGVRCAMRSGSILTRGAATSTALPCGTARRRRCIGPGGLGCTRPEQRRPALLLRARRRDRRWRRGAAAEGKPGRRVGGPIEAGRRFTRSTAAPATRDGQGRRMSTTSGVAFQSRRRRVESRWQRREVFRTIAGHRSVRYDEADGRMSDDDIWNTVNFLRDLARQAK
jgi:hypothetical protein